MKTARAIAIGLALGLVAAAPATAQDSRWSVSFDLGADVPVSGDVHAGGTGTVLDLATTVQARDYREIYGTPLTWSLGVGYMTTPNGEFRIELFRTTGEAEETQVGDVATLPLYALFDDYAALGMEFGWRQYYGDEGAVVRPYGGASAGFLNVDAIDATFSVPAASVVLSDVPMYDSSTVFSFAVSGGVLVHVNENFGLTGGVDLRWHGDLEPIDGLAGTGLEPINDESRRWSLPISGGILIRF